MKNHFLVKNASLVSRTFAKTTNVWRICDPHKNKNGPPSQAIHNLGETTIILVNPTIRGDKEPNRRHCRFGQFHVLEDDILVVYGNNKDIETYCLGQEEHQIRS